MVTRCKLLVYFSYLHLLYYFLLFCIAKKMNTFQEDDILIQMVGPHCKNKWSDIAHSIPGRSREQCRER